MYNNITITSYDHKGQGIAKVEGKIIFVPNTIVGEIVNIKITKEKKNYMEGKVTAIIKESPTRVKRICPYYEDCGGCDLLHLPYDEQLKYKENKIKNIVNQYLKEKIEITSIVSSDQQLNYRNKVTFQADKENIGFFSKKSNKIVNIDSCLLLDKSLNNYLKELKKSNCFEKKKIILRTNGKQVLDNEDKIIKTIGKYQFKVSLTSFFQINDNVTLKMYEKIKEYCNLSKDDNVLDLYCGIGTIGIYLSELCKKVLGVEINEQAIKDANENKKLNKIDNITFIADNVNKVIDKLNFKPTIIIVDPPRAGLDTKTINQIIKFKPKKLIYTSCDPMTLVRDLKILKDHFKIEQITPFDMFPNTYHVECVCLLTKK